MTPGQGMDAVGDAGPLVVIVTGLPCTGKTTIARQIAAAHGLPLATKDEYKELLFDVLGWGDRAQSRCLGLAAVGVLDLFTQSHVRATQPCVVECNYKPEAAAGLIGLQQRHPFRPFQVVCRTDGSVLLERFAARTGTRHPGHGDEDLIDESRPQLLAGEYAPLDIGGTLWVVDTTEWGSVDLVPLLDAIGDALG